MNKKVLSGIVALMVLAILASSQSLAFPVIKDADDQVIGGFLGYVPPSSPTVSSSSYADYLMVSQTGYVFALNYEWDEANNLNFYTTAPVAIIRRFATYPPTSERDPRGEQVHFASNDCSGQGYIQNPQNGIITSLRGQDDVYAGVNFTGNWLYYSPKGSSVTKITPRSYLRALPGRNEIHCDAVSMSESWMVPALPNDPAVTGVSEATFALPIYFDFDYRFGTPEIFYDRFQNSNE